MISTGDNSCIEFSPCPPRRLPDEGKFAHLALAAKDVDACIERVRAAGYPVTIEPKDVTLADLSARIAFCTGACGERSILLRKIKFVETDRSRARKRALPLCLIRFWKGRFVD